MKIIKLDASRWSTILEFYHDLLLALGAPKWHGASVDALVDTMIWGHVNAVDPPYTVEVLHLDGATHDVVEHAGLVRDSLSEAREEFRRTKGRDVEVQMEIVAGDTPLRAIRSPIDMSLRLWSAEVPLAPVVAALGVVADRLHDKGAPVPDDGCGPSAARHFAVIAQAEGADDVALSDWLRRTTALIAADADLVGLLRSGAIEALFWVTILGRHLVPTPTLDAEIAKALAELNAELFLQNYTDCRPREGGPPYQKIVVLLTTDEDGKYTRVTG